MRTLENVWTENECIKKFGATRRGEEKNLQIGQWIRRGLPYILLSSRRYFFEDDIIAFLEKHRKERSNSVETE